MALPFFFLKQRDLPSESRDVNEIDIETPSPALLFVEQMYSQLALKRLVETVRSRGRQKMTSFRYERDASIREFVKQRSGCHCEMPGCEYVGFPKPNGRLDIEMHHIVPLGEEGEDLIQNIVAVCPTCHKKAHYSTETNSIRQLLLATVREANRAFLADLNPT